MHTQRRIGPTPPPGDEKPNLSLWAPPTDDAVEQPLSRVSISGLNIVLSRQACWPRRLLWLLVLLALLGWLVTQLMVPIERLAHGGTSWDFSRRFEDSVRLPALTICHSNKFNKTVIEEMSVPGVGLLDWLSDDTEPFSLLDWDRYDLDQFFEAAGYDWDGMVSQCLIGKRECSELGEVRTVQSPMLGQCATLVSNATVQASLLSPQVRIVLTENGSFSKHEHDGWTLFMHQNDIVFNDFVLFAGLAKPVRLFANSSITVKVDTNLNLLLASTGRCGDATAPEYQSCLERCIIEQTMTNTTCRIPWLPFTIGLPPCTNYQDFIASGLRLPSFNEKKMWHALKLCPCTQPCSWFDYILSTPHRIGVGETRGALSTRRPSRGQVMTQVQLWFSTTVQTTEERETYPVSQFLADMGGSLGLMIGASLLTVAEVVDYMVCTGYRIARRRWAFQ